MIYLLCNPAVVDEFNRSLMRLMRPAHLRDGYTTDKYATQLIHPTTGYAALALPEKATVPIHIESDGSELSAMLDIFVNDGALLQEEADGIKDQLMGLAGQSVSILDFVPASWSAFVLTREQMESDGWFPQENI